MKFIGTTLAFLLFCNSASATNETQTATEQPASPRKIIKNSTLITSALIKASVSGACLMGIYIYFHMIKDAASEVSALNAKIYGPDSTEANGFGNYFWPSMCFAGGALSTLLFELSLYSLSSAKNDLIAIDHDTNS